MSYAFQDGLPYVTMVLGEILDWSRNWSDELKDGETIDSSVWTVPTGLTAGAESESGAYTSQWVTAAAVGKYALVNAMTTSEGRKFIRTLTVEVVASK